MKKRSVLVIQNSAPEATGAIGEELTRNQIVLHTVHPYSGEALPPELGDAAGLVIMGGPIGVYEQAQHPFLKGELKLIEHALGNRRPILGVCLGSQLLATALGAVVDKGVRKEIGWHPVWLSKEAEHDPLWTGASPHFIAFHWHGDLFSPPTGAASLAHSELTSCQAFRYDRSAYGLLFHLEVTETLIRAMVGAFARELSEASLDGIRIVEAIPKHLPGLQKLGSKVFAQWATLLE
jgi:GMP synthase (glutamine-hydrolysing)